MPRIINVEKSQYLTKNIEVFTKNKVGQYSKFLDKNPLFVIYLSINSIESRTDVGTGGIDSDVGPKSPIRFNRIDDLPVYNIPEIKPNAEFDDATGYDIQIDLNDVALLPNTIKPKSGDYVIVKLPNSYEVAFRVNAFNYNTIQSNDFYTFDADLKYTGHDLIKKFEAQIVDEFVTIFENIGTEDKCFIRKKDVAKLQDIAKLFNELRDLYKTSYFDQETGNFVCKNNDECLEDDDFWYYDKYVEKFIMDSEIYMDESSERTIALAPADIVEQSDRWYPRTLQYAVLKKDTSYMGRFPYCYQVGIQKRLSTFVVNGIPVKTSYLHITDYPLIDNHSDGLDSQYLYEYFPHRLIHITLDEAEGTTMEHKYDPEHCWKMDKDDPPVNFEEDTSYKFTYLDDIVHNFLIGEKFTIDRKKLVSFALQINNYVYRMMPLIIYIILDYYNSYFKSDEYVDL